MNVYELQSVSQRLSGNSYPGRGIIIGKSEDGQYAVAAYFIMGRSANSRNRIFAEHDGAVFTEPYDAGKVEDPSLIIYAAIRRFENNLIVTNGNQTDTVYSGLAADLDFAKALEQRCFEPDPPNFTPRISGLLTFADNNFTYQMNILKSGDAAGTFCNRFTFCYGAQNGVGHFLHTYVSDGNPIPTFQGEPERVAIPNDIDSFTREIWESLDENNKISLYVRYIRLSSGAEENRMINRNQ